MLIHLCTQWGTLALWVAFVLSTGLIAGWGVVLTLLPRRFALRWPVFAPIAGLAVLTVLGLPLSLLGAPVASFAPSLLAGLALFAAAATWKLRRQHALLRGRRALAYLRARGARLLLLGSIVTALATYLLTSQGRGDVSNIWGSGDFSAYWAVSDYLLQHGGNSADYAAQTEFRNSDIDDHINLHARLGNMVYIAEIATVFDPARLPRIINPVIVSAMLLLVAVGGVWLESFHCRALWPLLIVACHPFLFFLLYFSYASQATGVVLTFAGFLLACQALLGRDRPASARLCGIASALLLAAALLHHPTMSPVLGVMLVTLAASSWFSRRGRFPWDAWMCLGTALLACTFYYLPAVWREMRWLSGPTLRGWEWQRPIAFGEIAGVRTVLSYWMLPTPLTHMGWLVEIGAGAFLLTGAVFAWIARRNRLVFGVLATVTAILAGASLQRVFQHVPNATHSYVKSISLFVLFLLLGTLAGWAARLSRLASLPARVGVGLLLAVWLFAELKAVRIGSFQAPQFEESLVPLVRRLVSSRQTFAFDPKLNLDFQKQSPAARDTRWIAPPSAITTGAVLITRQPDKFTGRIIDREGPYCALASAVPNLPILP